MLHYRYAGKSLGDPSTLLRCAQDFGNRLPLRSLTAASCFMLTKISSSGVQCYSNNMPYNVFVSYSTKDIPDVNALRAYLQFPEVSCFVSEYTVVPGTPLAQTIQNAIQSCDLFVLLWSKNAAGSEWVPQEIGIAHASKKPILPFVLEPNVSLPGFISGLRYVAAYQNPQQAGFMLREAVLRNALTKQSQQNTLGLLAIGGLLLWFFKSAK